MHFSSTRIPGLNYYNFLDDFLADFLDEPAPPSLSLIGAAAAPPGT